MRHRPFSPSNRTCGCILWLHQGGLPGLVANTVRVMNRLEASALGSLRVPGVAGSSPITNLRLVRRARSQGPFLRRLPGREPCPRQPCRETGLPRWPCPIPRWRNGCLCRFDRPSPPDSAKPRPLRFHSRPADAPRRPLHEASNGRLPASCQLPDQPTTSMPSLLILRGAWKIQVSANVMNFGPFTHHAMASSDRIGLVQDVESLVVTVCDARILAANPSHA